MKTTPMKSLLVAVALALMLVGCAVPTKTISKSGFLTNYSILEKNEDERWPADWLYIKEGVDWNSYDKIIVERVQYFVNENSDYLGVSAEDLIILASIFNDEYLEALKDNWVITDKPGPNTLRIRSAIVGLTPNKPLEGTITTITPPGLALSHIKKATTGTHIGMGGVVGEVELIDSQTREVLAAGIDDGTGKKYKILESMTTWGQVEQIMKMWAERFTEHIAYLKNR